MKPQERINSIVISITTMIVFGLWLIIKELIIKYPKWFTDPNNQEYNIIGIVAIGFISIGIYRSLIILVTIIIKKINWIKKGVLSSYYLEGTWIGFYIGVSGNVRYIIETYEQTLDNLVIKGISFDENKNLHTFWTSESYNINIESGEITYQYKVKATKENTDPNGIAYFSFIRGNNKKPPKQIVGYSADSHLTLKCKAMEKKYNDSTDYDIEKALEEAVKFYQSKKDNVFNYKKKVS